MARRKFDHEEIIEVLREACQNHEIVCRRNGDEDIMPPKKAAVRLTRRVYSALKRKGMLRQPSVVISKAAVEECIVNYETQSKGGIGGPHRSKTPLCQFVLRELKDSNRLFLSCY